VRPLAEDALMLKTYLASRADEKSKVISELVRAFMRKLPTVTPATPLPVGRSASARSHIVLILTLLL
jgi:hypothetical protein